MELYCNNVNLLFFDTVKSNYKVFLSQKIIEKQTQPSCGLLEEEEHFILFSKFPSGPRDSLVLGGEIARC